MATHGGIMDKRRIPVIRGERLRAPIDVAAPVSDLFEPARRETNPPDGTDCTAPLTPPQEMLNTDSSDGPWGP